MQPWMWIVISVFVLLIVTVFIPLILKDRKKEVKENLSEEFIKISEALGLGNLIKVEQTLDRIKLTIKDKSLININSLKDLNIMATIKELELTILYRKDSNSLYKYLKDLV